MKYSIVVLIQLFLVVSPLENFCYFNYRVDLFKCFAKRLRADAAVRSCNGSDESVARMISRCDDFSACIEPVKACSFGGYQAVQESCKNVSFAWRLIQCSAPLMNDSTAQTKITISFEKCVQVGKEENKSECVLLKECTESLINNHCHASVIPEMTKRYGSILYDVSECNDNDQEASGSQLI